MSTRLALFLAPLVAGSQATPGAYLKAANLEAGDQLGWALAASGATVVAGARFEDGGVGEPVPDPGDNSQIHAGAAHVFVQAAGGWSHQAYLKAPSPGRNDQFGFAVAVFGDTLVIGAPFEDGSASGVGGNPADDGALDSGAAFVFAREGSAWTLQAYLKASNTGAGDEFGCAVATDGERIVVGARGEDSRATGVNGNQAEESFPDSGAAYVFLRSGTSWVQEAYLKPSIPGMHDRFGSAVALAGTRLAVGAPFEDSAASGVGGNQSNDLAPDSGAAYVFALGGGGWSQEAYVKASQTGAFDEFARSLALGVDTLLVGAWREDGSALDVDGPVDEGASDSGAAYVLERQGSTWSHVAYLKASNTDPYDGFGLAVALADELALVGAPGESSAAITVDGDGLDDSAPQAGAGYLFAREAGGAWVPRSYVKAWNGQAGDAFAWSVALTPEALLLGAVLEDGASTRINGDPADDSASAAGALYAFSLAGGPTSFCEATLAACPCGNAGTPGHGCDNAQGTGGVQLFATGTPALDDVVLHGTGFPIAGTPGVIVMRSPGLEGAPVSFGDGSRCVASAGLVRLGATSAANAISTHPLSHGAGPGAFHYQLWYRNTPASFCTPDAFNASNGLTIVWP